MLTITLTGADERTDRDTLGHFAQKHPRLEVGLLLSLTPDGRNRYPRPEWIRETLDWPGLAGRCALHVCGTAAREALMCGSLADMVYAARRVQVNGLVKPDDLRQLCMCYPEAEFITQHGRPSNDGLLFLQCENHSVLFDQSGGRGIEPPAWEPPPEGCQKAFGYAGGLGPENVREQVQAIARVATLGWWIDMEGKLRADDWFSLPRCHSVLEQLRVLPPLTGELWLHAVHGPVAIERVIDDHHVRATVNGRGRVIERALLENRMALLPTGLVEDRPQ